MARLICLLVLSLGVAGADPREELMEADKAFDLATARQGLDGWMSFFADDAQLNTPSGPLRGRDALKNHYSRMFAQQDFSIRWKPYYAEASKDGTLGFTLGTAVITWTNPDGRAMKRDGRYITVWRKQPDGAWRAVTDMGN